MSHNKEQFTELLEKYMLDQTSVEEEELLFSMIRKGDHGEAMDQHVLNSLLKETTTGAGLPAEKAQEIIGRILPETYKRTKQSKQYGLYRKWAAAAAILVLFTTGLYFLFDSFSETELSQSVRFKTDIAPGGNKAILTLADGSSIVLDSVQNGTLAREGHMQIIKLNNSQLLYSDSARVSGAIHSRRDFPIGTLASLEMNTLRTPRGGQYRLTLPDGTNVWLNAASSVTFPTAFTEKERRVTVTGEAYFEVAKNTEMSFIVKINDRAEVKVLGTHFNINAYDDESSINTTLLEGSVRMSSLFTGDGLLISPGQQLSLDENNELSVKEVDTSEIMAWKNGLIACKNANIKSIMRQIARWYDVEVSYESEATERFFTGEISRNTNLSEVLKILELSNIRFRIEEKSVEGESGKAGKIIVMK